MEDYIIPYFKEINKCFNNKLCNLKNYRVGIYAPRHVCKLVSDEKLAVTSFVADMSTGFSGNLGYPIPNNWAFDQFFEYFFNSSPGFDLDNDAYSGRDPGCSDFDDPVAVVDKDLLQALRENSTTNILGIFFDSPIGEKTLIDLPNVTLKYKVSAQTQIAGDYMTVDFGVTTDSNGAKRVTLNGKTLDDGNVGLSLTRAQEATLYGYFIKLKNFKARIKSTISAGQTTIELEFLHTSTVENRTIQASELYTLQYRKLSFDDIIESIKKFYEENIILAITLTAIVIILAGVYVIPAILTSPGIAALIAAFNALISFLMGALPA